MKHVLIVGAGLAGAAAAYRLDSRGFAVTLLEASNRVGGRAFARSFGTGTDQADILEFGGSWIAPWHNRTRELVAQLGHSFRPRQKVANRLRMKDGVVHSHLPLDHSERLAHEQALARIARDCVLIKKGATHDELGRPLTRINYLEYVNRVNPPRFTRDIFNAWWAVSGSGAHDIVAASEFLSSCSYGNGSPEAMIDVWQDTVSPTMSKLVEDLIRHSGAKLHLNMPVSAVAHGKNEVEISTKSGRKFSASHAIIALGINQMGQIRFAPGLRKPMKEVVVAGHGGRAFKVWIKARGVALGTLVSGDSSGIELLFAERAASDGAVFLVGFGLDQNGVEPGNPAWVRQQLAKLLPQAEYLASDWHDWLRDPFARGTWVAAPAYQVEFYAASHWQAQGRIAFASSDYASDQAGWFEGAVISGEAAADHIASLVSQ